MHREGAAQGENRLRRLMVLWFMLVGLALVGLAGAVGSATGAATAVTGSESDMPCEVSVPVLLYHNLAAVANGRDGGTISMAEFEAEMAFLDAHGFRTITTKELQGWLTRGERLPDHPVLITFDDGYASVFRLAYPVLRRYHMKATLFLVGGATGETIRGAAHVTWEQLREMTGNFTLEVQAHTFAGHGQTNGVSDVVRWTAGELSADASRLERTLVAHGLGKPTAFAYPFGQHDAGSVQRVAELYQLAFTVEPGINGAGSDRFRLKRQVIFPGIGLERFADLVQAECAR